MQYSKDKKVIIDDFELVFSEFFFCKKDGVVIIEINGVKIQMRFETDESNDAKTKMEVPSSKDLTISCLNYDKTFPSEQGLFEKRKVYSVGDIAYYLQFSSSILSNSTNTRRVSLTMTKDIE